MWILGMVRNFPVQRHCDFCRVLAQMLCEVLKCSDFQTSCEQDAKFEAVGDSAGGYF